MDKKLIILYILKILQEETDIDNRLSFDDLIGRLKEYNIECERKTVARNINWLADAGYDVVHEHRGTYLRERKFSDEELRLLIDGVLANRYLCVSHTTEVVGKLLTEGTPKLRKSIHTVSTVSEWDKVENKGLLLATSSVGDAIDNNCKIQFTYNEYGLDKELHPRHAKGAYTASPYQLIIHNQRYYVMCNKDNTDNLRFLRMDYMSDVTLLNRERRRDLLTVKGADFDAEKIASCCPYLFADHIVCVAIRIDENYLTDVFDWFGTRIRATACQGGYMIRFETSPSALRYWLLQYGLHATVIEPPSLVQQLKEDSRYLYEKYNGNINDTSEQRN